MKKLQREHAAQPRADRSWIRLAVAIALACGILTAPHAALAFDARSMVIFGDSNSDTGNLFRATKRKQPSPARYFRGRFSNGPVWPEHLKSRLRIQIQVKAYGGAFTGYRGTAAASRGMRAQVDQYLRKRRQRADPGALHFLWAGANDLKVVKDKKDVNRAIRQATRNIATAVTQLAAGGATSIAVGNMPNLGATPSGRSGRVFSPGQWSRYSRRFNRSLRSALAATGIRVKVVDMYPLLGQIQSAPGRYGFSNTKQSCLATRCKNPNTQLFWDRNHLTTRGHRMLAEYLRSRL